MVNSSVPKNNRVVHWLLSCALSIDTLNRSEVRKERGMIKNGIIELVVVLSLLGSGAAQATAPTGTIQGSVVDSSEAIIAGV